MGRYVQGGDRPQVVVLPERLDDYIVEDNPVRVVEAFVSELDLQALGFEAFAIQLGIGPGSRDVASGGRSGRTGCDDATSPSTPYFDSHHWIIDSADRPPAVDALGCRQKGGVIPDSGHAMTPSHELLARIRWDPEFGAARFVIGYHDRLIRGEVNVPLERIRFPSGEHFSFEAQAADGTLHTVPYHRVRNVWRNGELLWHRDAPPP